MKHLRTVINGRRGAFQALFGFVYPLMGKVTNVRHRVARIVNGRRGAFQALFGFVYLLMGISYVFLPSSPGRVSALGWIAGTVPLHVLGILWLIAAAMGAVGSLEPRPRDRASFMALAVVPALWGGGYAAGAVATGNYSYLLTTLLYLAIATAVLVVSGMSGASDRDIRPTAPRCP